MTKSPSSPGRTWKTSVASLFIVALLTSDLSECIAKETYHCPAGQIYRVGKRLCVPKTANLTLLKSSRPKAAHTVPARSQTHMKDDTASRAATPPREEAPPLDTARLSPPLPQGLSAASAPAAPKPAQTSPYGGLPYNAFPH